MQRVSDQKQLQELKYRGKNILLHFVTEWCNPCKLSRKLLETEATKNYNNFVIAQVNCDQAEQLVLDYKIEGVPTFIVLDKNLKVVKKMMGYLPEKVKNLLRATQDQKS